MGSETLLQKTWTVRLALGIASANWAIEIVQAELYSRPYPLLDYYR